MTHQNETQINAQDLATVIDWMEMLYKNCVAYAKTQESKRISTAQIDVLVKQLPKLDMDAEDTCVVTVEKWIAKADLALSKFILNLLSKFF